MGNLVSALDFYIESLNIRKKVNGHNHRTVSVCLNNIVLLLQQKGRLSDAITCLKKTPSMDKATFGEFHESWS